MKEAEVFYKVTLEGVVVDVTYSGGVDASGNEILEFEWARALAADNPNMSAAELEEFNDDLECGFEEHVVCQLKEMYAGSGILFLDESAAIFRRNGSYF